MHDQQDWKIWGGGGEVDDWEGGCFLSINKILQLKLQFPTYVPANAERNHNLLHPVPATYMYLTDMAQT